MNSVFPELPGPSETVCFAVCISFLLSPLASEDCERCRHLMNLYTGGRDGKPGAVPGTQ